MPATANMTSWKGAETAALDPKGSSETSGPENSHEASANNSTAESWGAHVCGWHFQGFPHLCNDFLSTSLAVATKVCLQCLSKHSGSITHRHIKKRLKSPKTRPSELWCIDLIFKAVQLRDLDTDPMHSDPMPILYHWHCLTLAKDPTRHMGAVLNLSLFMRYFTHLALALAPSCAFQGFSAKSCPNIKLVYFAFHEAWLARVTFTIYRVFICRHLFLHFLNCCHS